MRVAGAVLCCLFALAPNFCRAENLRVLVVLSDGSVPYQSFANALGKNLPASVQATVAEQPEELVRQAPADLIVAVGMKASLSALSQTGTPVLAVMIPKAGYDELLAQTSAQKRSQDISAIYLDQPWARQLDFVQAALPGHHRIGLLYSSSTHIDLSHLRQQAVERGATLIAKQVLDSAEVFSRLDDVLGSCDVLIALPDNTIYNSGNIRNIILSSYRFDIPFIGLSQAYVTAGALGAIYSSPQQTSDQVSATILNFARTGKLLDPQYPREFSISLNPEVARSLSIELPTADSIRNKMNSVERLIP